MMGAMGIAPLFVAAAAGYWVVTQAEHQKGGIQKLGRYLGTAIIILSVVLAGCKLYAFAARCGMSGKAICPVTGNVMTDSAAPQAGR